MEEEQAVFEQLTSSDFKKWSSTALYTHSQNFGNCPLKMMKIAFHLKYSSRSHDI